MEHQTPNLDYPSIIEHLGEGLLIFDSDGQFVLDNPAARRILGANLVTIRQQGWPAYAMLVKGLDADEIRAKAWRQAEPVRFHMMLSDAYIPCWMSVIRHDDDQHHLLVCIEQPDWTPLIELLEDIRKEGLPAIDDTRGHANFIVQIATRRKEGMTADQLAERVIGFAELISTQMGRMMELMQQLHRLEIIRTGRLKDMIQERMRPISLMDFFEDYLEEIATNQGEDIRDRLEIDIADEIKVMASRQHINFIVDDVITNALMYSKPNAPIRIHAFTTNQGRSVQIDFIDHGYGIREAEYDRVFAIFQRARQPQVIAEFGYGLSLNLAKTEIEAMGGRIWFTSEEGVGTTFSVKLSSPTAAESQSD